LNTPAHIIVNMAVLGRGQRVATQVAVLVGSFLPDAPMFWFYFVEKILRNTPERIIWEKAYFHNSWQSLIDLFNSIPVIAMGIVACWWFRTRVGIALFLSMLLHVALDFPLHHDDAHRHFFPLLGWRFESPLSYWDPNHYGNIVGGLEIALVLSCTILVFLFGGTRFSQWVTGMTIITYAAFYIFVVRMWSGM